MILFLYRSFLKWINRPVHVKKLCHHIYEEIEKSLDLMANNKDRRFVMIPKTVDCTLKVNIIDTNELLVHVADDILRENMSVDISFTVSSQEELAMQKRIGQQLL